MIAKIVLSLALLYSTTPYSDVEHSKIAIYTSKEQESSNTNLEDTFKKREERLFSLVKCMVCAGESIKESRTEFASTVRTFIKAKIRSGKGDDEIIEFLRKKYGEEIVFQPSFSIANIILWIAPYLALSILILLFSIKHKNKK